MKFVELEKSQNLKKIYTTIFSINHAWLVEYDNSKITFDSDYFYLYYEEVEDNKYFLFLTLLSYNNETNNSVFPNYSETCFFICNNEKIKLDRIYQDQNDSRERVDFTMSLEDLRKINSCDEIFISLEGENKEVKLGLSSCHKLLFKAFEEFCVDKESDAKNTLESIEIIISKSPTDFILKSNDSDYRLNIITDIFSINTHWLKQIKYSLTEQDFFQLSYQENYSNEYNLMISIISLNSFDSNFPHWSNSCIVKYNEKTIILDSCGHNITDSFEKSDYYLNLEILNELTNSNNLSISLSGENRNLEINFYDSHIFLFKSFEQYCLENFNDATEILESIKDIVSNTINNIVNQDDANCIIDEDSQNESENNILKNTDNDFTANKEELENAMQELESFTGMTEIKNDVQTLMNLIKIQKQREERGLSVIKPSLHMVFTGPPGTGKTTVARVMGKIFKALGVLEKGHIVETDRSGLVAGYLGQTAIKVDEIVNNAKGGILFIDEAYTLSPSTHYNDSFGQEAIDTLLKRMEDFRESLVIIVAGYEKEMQTFIESNPGFKSRFNKHIKFQDYKPEELSEIFLSIVKKNKYIASQDLISLLSEKFSEMYNNKTRSFGNAREVRNIFEKIIETQANRLSNINNENLSIESLQLLLPEDYLNI